jgi:hypothetical protein
MRRFFAFAVLFVALAFSAHAQYARRIVSYPALPATCNPLNGEIANLTVGGATAGLYSCTALNVWRPAGVSNNTLTIAQGTLLANAPAISVTSTWNNGAVAFQGVLVNITNTASAAGARLFDVQLAGASQLSVDINGFVRSANQFVLPRTGFFTFTNGVNMSTFDTATGFALQTSALAPIGYFNLGPASVDAVRIGVSAAVGGQAQGIIILKGDGTAATQANLGAATNGSMIYCSDCTVASPCAGGGTGAIAKRLNGAWVCN